MSLTKKVKLDKKFVVGAKPPIDKDQIFYRDNKLNGFALRVTANGVKSFVVEKNIGNKVRRITLGKFGALTAEQARKEAEKIIPGITTFINTSYIPPSLEDANANYG